MNGRLEVRGQKSSTRRAKREANRKSDVQGWEIGGEKFYWEL